MAPKKKTTKKSESKSTTTTSKSKKSKMVDLTFQPILSAADQPMKNTKREKIL